MSSSSLHTHKLTTPNLILRPIHPTETPQFRHLRSDPKNNLFSAIPDPRTRERSLALGLGYAAEQGIVNLFVVLKPPSSNNNSHGHDDKNKHKNRVEYEKECEILMVKQEIAIGVMQICPPEPEPETGEKASEIGGYIHHLFTGLGYGTEAFRAVINYALIDLAREEVVLGTKKGNVGFRGVMRSLGLEGLEGPGCAWIEDGEWNGKEVKEGGKEESVRWVFRRREWEVAKRDVEKRRLLAGKN